MLTLHPVAPGINPGGPVALVPVPIRPPVVLAGQFTPLVPPDVVAAFSGPPEAPTPAAQRLTEMDGAIDEVWAAMDAAAVHVRAFLRWLDWLATIPGFTRPRWAEDEAHDLRGVPWLLELVAGIDRPVPPRAAPDPTDPAAPFVVRFPEHLGEPKDILADVASERHYCREVMTEWAEKYGPGEPYYGAHYVRDLTGAAWALEQAMCCLWGNINDRRREAAWERLMDRIELEGGAE